MQKKICFTVAILVIIFVFLYLFQNSLIFVYNNPSANIEGLSYIAPTIKNLDRGLEYAKKDNSITYIYQNAYGSGFLNNNPIPNDLDYSVGINLGKFHYDGKNSEEIANKIVDKIFNFQYAFTYYMNLQNENGVYPATSLFELLKRQETMRNTSVEDISEHIDDAISSIPEYIKYTRKSEGELAVDMPYVMKSGEILLQNMYPIIVYSKNIFYNNHMRNYLREISIVPEFYLTIEKDSKEYKVEIVPESYMGARLQISRRFFAPAVFVKNYSGKFLKNSKYISDDDVYLELRLLSFRRHLQEIKNLKYMNSQYIKLLKRIMQCADILKPVLSEENYSEISDFVLENLSKKDLQLLNEYTNICSNIFMMATYKNLYKKLSNNGEIEMLYKEASDVVSRLSDENAIKDDTFAEKLKQFHNDKLKAAIEGTADIMEIYEKDYQPFLSAVNTYISKNLTDPSKVDKFIEIYNDVYQKSGYKMVNLLWLDKNTIGILKDENTVKIPDLNSFAKENNLPSVKYKLIDSKDIPSVSLKHTLWVRYQTTKDQDDYYREYEQKMLDDRSNFKIKKKFILN